MGCRVLEYVGERRTELIKTNPFGNHLLCCSISQCFAVCCSVLQYVAVYCSVLQSAVVCCNMLQYARKRRTKLIETSPFGNHFVKLGALHGFSDVVVHSSCHTLVPIPLHGIRSDRNDRYLHMCLYVCMYVTEMMGTYMYVIMCECMCVCMLLR